MKLRFLLILSFCFLSLAVFAQPRLIISTQLEKSLTPYSILTTDSLGNPVYLPPGSDGQVLGLSGGIFDWQAAGTTELGDGNTLIGDGTIGNPFRADTSILITSTALLDTLQVFRDSLSTGVSVVDNNTIVGDGTGGNPLRVDTGIVVTQTALLDSLQVFRDTLTSDSTLLKIFTTPVIDTTCVETALDSADYTLNLSINNFWGKYTEYINSSRSTATLKNYSTASGDLFIAFLSLDGTNATVLKYDTLSVTAGLNTIDLDTTGLNLNSENIYIAVRPSDVGVAKYYSPGGTSVFFSTNDTPVAITNNSTFDYAFWLEWCEYKDQDLLETIADNNIDIEAIKIRTGTYTSGFLQSLIDTQTVIHWPIGVDTIDIGSETLNIPSNRKIIGVPGVSVLKSNGTAILLDTVSNVTIEGLVIIGDYTTPNINSATPFADYTDVIAQDGRGGDSGIRINGLSRDIIIRDVQVFNFDDAGIDLRLSEAGIYESKVNLINVKAFNCYKGFDFVDRSEYITPVNIEADGCFVGIRIQGGNNFYSSSNFSRNRVGVHITDGVNDSHGGLIGTPMNHCPLYGLLADSISFGFQVIGCDFFASEIYSFRNSGLMITDGVIADNITSNNDNYLSIKNNRISGTPTITEVGSTNIQTEDNYNFAGEYVDGFNDRQGYFENVSGGVQIDSAIGVGTDPDYPLHVNDGNGVVAGFEATGTVGYLQIQNSVTGGNGTTDGFTLGMNSLNAFFLNREAGQLNFGTQGNTNFQIEDDGDIAWYRSDLVTRGVYYRAGTGRFGINVTPSEALDVVGNIELSGILKMTPTATVPSSPASGWIYFDDGTNTVSGNPAPRFYDGTAWVDMD